MTCRPYLIRFAIISSPRSGNTWVRNTLGSALRVPTYAEHHFSDFSQLEGSLGIQIHWPREQEFISFLSENSFMPIVVSRHPLDIFCSMMHFIRHEPETSRWLGGKVDIPPDLKHHSPASAAFLDYATSTGAEHLLSVTHGWWQDPAAMKLRYEDAVSEGAVAFARSLQRLGLVESDFAAPLVDNNLAAFQATPNHHGWQGKPGLWKEIIPRDAAGAIYERHRRVFDTLQYAIDGASASVEDARARWQQLVVGHSGRALWMGD